MSASAPSVCDLRLVRDRLANSAAEADQRVALALSHVLSGADPKEALGLKGEPGRRSPLKAQIDQDRNQLIRQIARTFLAHLGTGPQASAIVAMARRYENGPGRFDRFNSAPPRSYVGTPRALLFEIQRIGAQVPNRRRVIDILSECSELGVFAAS